MEAFVRGVRLLSKLCGYVAAALIGCSVIVVCEMVFVRYALNMNTIWQTDFVTYSLVAATKRLWFALFASVLSLAFCVTMAVLTFQFWQEAWDHKWVSDTMWRARLWIPYASMPIGLGILTLQCIADLLSLATGREAPFGIRTERAK